MQIERQLEINEARHYRADDRYAAKIDRAHALIGELCREGRAVYYINLRPLAKGKTKEGDFVTLSEYLIRNRYV